MPVAARCAGLAVVEDLVAQLLEIRQAAERGQTAIELWPRYFEIRYLDFLALLPIIPPRRCARVLEIGCGIGYYTAFLSRLAEKVVAVDLVEASSETQTPGLRRARDFVNALGIENVTLCGASAENLPFADGSFDLVISNHVLEHVPDRRRAVREMHRVLSPGGHSICVVPTRADRLYTFPWYHAYLVKRALVHAGRMLVGALTARVPKSPSGSLSPRGMLTEFPWPPTHGAFRNYLDELRSWSCARWRKLVTDDGRYELVCQRSTQFLPFPLLDIVSRSAAVALYRHSLAVQQFLGRVPSVQGAGLNTVLVTRPRKRGGSSAGKRILFVVEQSGRSRYYEKLFRHFKSRSRNEFHVVSLRPAEGFFALIRESVRRTSSLGRFSRYYFAVGSMISTLRDTNPALVHAHELIPAFYAALALLLSFSRAKLVYHRHHERTSGLRMKLFDLTATFRATRIVAVSGAMSQLATREHPWARDKITFLHNGIDLEGEAAGEPAPLLPDSSGKILLLGRMRPEKGHGVALAAMEIVRERLPEATLWLAGTGSLETKLRQEVADRELSHHVSFLGHVDDVAGILRQVDLVIMPSLTEAFGLSAIEAMAAKRLVIASRVGGLPEIVEHGRSGVLVEPSKPEELAEQIVHFLEHPDERRRLAGSGYERYLERFTSDVMARNYLALYEELLGVD
jgi:glycosyltransferase involved in cell wall biosynthesis/SAM-dependent methyltransferase